ncbi:MAG: DUF4411 family protein [Candidatus Accumulibacter phosphatis]
MIYLLDANVFIQAKNLHYGLDFCPAFWEWLLENHAAGKVASIDKVGDEIAAGGDELTDWVRDHGDGMFLKTAAAVAAQFGAVSTRITGQHYEPAAINTFLQVADFYIGAQAAVFRYPLLTRDPRRYKTYFADVH